jgi:hypothetical protein
VRRAIGGKYEQHREIVLMERSELKAVEEPRLISDRRQQMTPTRTRAGIGT